MEFQYDQLVGARVRRLRLERGWTQEQLAARLQIAGCDVTRSALAKLEVGQRHFYSQELKALHEIFDVRYEDLLV